LIFFEKKCGSIVIYIVIITDLQVTPRVQGIF